MAHVYLRTSLGGSRCECRRVAVHHDGDDGCELTDSGFGTTMGGLTCFCSIRIAHPSQLADGYRLAKRRRLVHPLPATVRRPLHADGYASPDSTPCQAERLTAVTPNPPRTASLAMAQTFSNSTTTSISFTIPSPTSVNLNTTDIIWAYSAQNPRSSALDARLVQHAASGYFVLPLLAALQAPATTTAGSSVPAGSANTQSAASGTPAVPEISLRPASITDGDAQITTTGDNRHLLLAHAVCGSLGTMVFIPLGVIIPRYARGLGTKRWWLPVHGVMNGLLGGVLVLITYIIARTTFHRHTSERSVHRVSPATAR